MEESDKLFIRRHLHKMLKENTNAQDAIHNSFSILASKKMTNKAISTFTESESISKTLHEMGVIKLPDLLIEEISKWEMDDSREKNSIVTMLDTEETISEIYTLLRSKLRIGLVYALWLSTIATVVFAIVSVKVLPQFQEIFANFGANLPASTLAAIAWQESIISPATIGVVFILIISHLIFSLKKLSTNGRSRSIIEYFPFVKSVISYTECIKWISLLRMLSSTGMDLKACYMKLQELPKNFEKYAPRLKNELSVAEDIGGLDTEFDYQLHRLNQHAQEIVSSTTRKLLAVVMSFVVGYVVFILYVTYMPIFQLGAVI